MNGRQYQKLMVIVLVGAMLAPVPAAADDAKKAFKRGQGLEAEKKYDQAAEAYMIALSEDPERVELRIAYQRAATQASVMLVRQGREALEQGRYEDAYNAFRRAYQFDKTNELAKDLASHALDQQKRAEGLVPVPVKETPYGSTLPIIAPSPLSSSRQTPLPGRSAGIETPEKDQLRETIIFRNQDLEDIIRELSKRVDLNVVFDSTFRTRKSNFEMRNVTVAQALDTLLTSNNLFFEPVNDNTLLVALDNTANRARLQEMSVQTFYLKSSDEQTVQTIQTTISALFGQRVMVVPNAQLRSLTVRSTPETLKVVSEIIKALDKDKPEVLIDISIYEVSRADLLEIGNQLLFDGFFGQSAPSGPVVPSTLNTLGVTAGQIISTQRLALAIPTTIIRMLQTRGHSRLIDSLQVHALDGQQVAANVGQRIPIQTASLPSSFATVSPTQPTQPTTGQNQQDRVLQSLSLGVPQIEYQDVGLNVNVTPTIYTDDDVKLEMEIETSGVQAGPTSLTPIFVQRRLKSVATVQTGQAAMMAGVMQRRNETSRTSLPVIGFLPIIGRFFSIPSERTNTTDLVITVTPHIIRSADIREEDKLAKSSGLQLQGVSQSIEEFLQRKEQARRQRQAPDRMDVARGRAEGTGLQVQPVSSLQPSGPVGAGGQQGVAGLSGTANQQNVTQAASAMMFDQATDVVREPAPSGTGPDREHAEEGSVNLLLQANNTQPMVGETFTVAAVATTSQAIAQGQLVLRFDPSVLRVRTVSPGALLTSAGQTPAVSFSQSPDGVVTVAIEMNEPGPSRPVSGSLVVFEFEVLNQGRTVLMVSPDATNLSTADGQRLHCLSRPLGIYVR